MHESCLRSLLQVGDSAFTHVTVPCNATVVGSVAACFDPNIDAQGNTDYNINDPKARSWTVFSTITLLAHTSVLDFPAYFNQ